MEADRPHPEPDVRYVGRLLELNLNPLLARLRSTAQPTRMGVGVERGLEPLRSMSRRNLEARQSERSRVRWGFREFIPFSIHVLCAISPLRMREYLAA